MNTSTIRNLVMDHIERTGKYPTYLFIDSDTFYNIMNTDYAYLHTNLLSMYGSFMQMEIVQVIGKKNFAWVG